VHASTKPVINLIGTDTKRPLATKVGFLKV
jgi:hypothetical protein